MSQDKYEKTEQEAAEIDLAVLLSDFLNAMRHTVLPAVVVTLLLCGGLCFRAYRSYTPLYEATSTFTVYVTDPLQVGIHSYNAATAEQMAKTFPYILTSSALGDMVMRDLEISAMPAVSASVMHNTNIFRLTVTAGDPELAYDVLQSVIRHYPEVAEFVVGPTVMNLLNDGGRPQAPINERGYARPIKKGVLMGAILWAAGAVLLALIRSTVHSEEELKRLLNLRCLGVLPYVKNHRIEIGWLVERKAAGRETSGFVEAVRLLRVRVEKQMDRLGAKVVLVSSAMPNEGKTTVAENLSVSFAQQGKNTLLVDCDLMNPSVVRRGEREAPEGLCELLRGEISLEEVVYEVEKNFSVLHAGQMKGARMSVFSSKQAKELLDQCRERYDVVILDTPPASLLADASDMAAAADGVLMVIRQNHASKRQILNGAEALADGGAPLLGCVLNYADKKPFGGYYGYSGYYGYGHYGKGHYGENPPDREEE